MIVRLVRRITYRGLRLLTAAENEFRRNLTPLAQPLFGLLGVAVLFGIDTRKSLAFQVVTLCVALFFVAGVALLVRRLRLGPAPELQVQLPRVATVGEPFSCRLSLRNLAATALSGCGVEPRLPDARPDLTTFLTTPAPAEAQAIAFDRLLGYPRWRYLLDLGRRSEPHESLPLAPLSPGGSARLQFELTPRKRGYLRLTGWDLLFDEPLGLLRGRRRLGVAGSVLVLPRRYPVPPITLSGSRHYQPGGVSQASSVGDSQEFIGLRDYRPGDTPRHIHWRSWARTGKPLVREFQDEFFSRHALVLDTFAAPGDDDRFECAVSVACSLIEPLSGGDALLDLLFVGTDSYQFTAGRGQLDPFHLYELLACAQPSGQPFSHLSELLLGNTARLSGALLVLLAWDAPRQALVQALRARGIPLRIAVVGGEGDDAERVGIALDDPAAGVLRLAALRGAI